VLSNRDMLRRLVAYMAPYLARLAAALVSMVFVAGLTALAMWLLKYVIDKIFILKDEAMLVILVVLIPIVYLFKDALTYAQNYLMAYVGQRTVMTMRDDLFSRLVHLDLQFFRRNQTGNLVAKITNDTQLIQYALVKVPVSVVRDGLTLVFLVGLIFMMHWKFALIVLVLFPVAAVPIVKLGRKMRHSSRTSQQNMGEIYSILEESITGNVVIKAFVQEEHEVARFSRKNREYFSNIMRYTRAEVLSNPLMEYIGALAVTFVLWYGGRDVIRGVWTTGAFFAFLGCFLSAYKPLKAFSQLNAVLQLAMAGAERMFTILDTAPRITTAPGAVLLPPFTGRVEFDRVTFSYEPRRCALNALSLVIPRGAVTALAGPSGAGKSTVAKLLMRFYDPDTGAIRIDGQDIRGVDTGSLRGRLGFVSQDVVLFNESVAYNIGYARQQAARAQIIEAATAANAHAFISGRPHGYDTVIGEKGCSLSGGQRQRLAIARAMLKDPEILILDEATSALDAESEQLVQEALEKLMQNRTVLVIAHRLSTVQRADRIILIEQGCVQAEGRHADLRATSPLYRRIFSMPGI